MAIGRTNASGGKKSPYPSAKDITISYTGIMAEPRDIYDAEGNKYKLLELQTSGVLTIDKEVPVDICLVGGGYNGTATSQYSSSNLPTGGAGAKLKNYKAYIKTLDCSIGGNNGGSTIVTDDGLISYTLSGVGTGRNSGTYTEPAKIDGDGESKYVFDDTSVYDYPICSSGGMGAFLRMNSSAYTSGYKANGVNGVENGANGNIPTVTFISSSPYPVTVNGGTGGRGAGSGGYIYAPSYILEASTRTNGTNATTYGSGGGGGVAGILKMQNYNSPSYFISDGGNGKEGVVFIRIRY